MAIIEKLDQLFIDTQLTCPSEKSRIEYVDPLRTGLYVEVRATSPGQGTYYLRYKDAASKTCHQRVFTGTLESLPTQIVGMGIKAPTLIIVGEVVTLREKLKWFETSPNSM